MTSATVDIGTGFNTDGLGNYLFQTYLHETGHALGLGHQGNYNGPNTPTYGSDNKFTNDTWQWSVMSYFGQDKYTGNNPLASYNYVSTPEIADISAIQTLYGVPTVSSTNKIFGFNCNAGPKYGDNFIYDFNAYAFPPALTIFDNSGGLDTLDCSGYSTNDTIDLTPTHWSSVGGKVDNIGIYTGTLINNIIAGSGNDIIIPNPDVVGTLTGGVGDDIFRSTELGLDGYTIKDLHGGDVINFTDAILSSFSFTFDGTTLIYGSDSLTLSSAPTGKFAATTDPVKGVDLTFDTTSPTLTEPKSTLPVSIGGTATLSHSFLWSYDTDKITGAYGDPAVITYTITTPAHGTVLLNGAATNTFTQADIDNNLVEYRQNGDDETSDGFTFTVSDPAGNSITEPFRIAIVNNSAPVIEANATLSAPARSATSIWTDSLSTVALGDTPDQMSYTVLDSPRHGAILLDGAPVVRFTQAEIDDHRVQYQNDGDGAGSDRFAFQVSDAQGDRTATTNFDIAISQLVQAMASFGASPNSAPLMSASDPTEAQTAPMLTAHPA
jgi:hypothetical protein